MPEFEDAAPAGVAGPARGRTGFNLPRSGQQLVQRMKINVALTVPIVSAFAPSGSLSETS